MRNLFFIIFIFFSESAIANIENNNILGDRTSGEIVRLTSAEKWDDARKIIDKIEDENKREFWLGTWFYGKGNNSYNPAKAISHFELSAKNGLYEAKMALVIMYLFSKDIQIANYQKGMHYAKEVFPYLQEREKTESPDILNNLGLFYIFGIVVDKDLKKSYEYYRQAVKFGSKEANTNFEALKKLFDSKDSEVNRGQPRTAILNLENSNE